METELMDTAISFTGGTVAMVSKAVVKLTASLCTVSKAAVPASYAVSGAAASGGLTAFLVANSPIIYGLGIPVTIAYYALIGYNVDLRLAEAEGRARGGEGEEQPTQTVAEHIIVGEDCTTSEPMCPICREDFKEHDKVIRLQCNPSVGHEFHNKCITAWAMQPRQNRCPMCRTPFDIVTV